MSREVLVTSSEFQKIRNPYTGSVMKVLMVVTGAGEPLFHAPDEYSTSDLQANLETCRRLWSRVDGVSGMRGTGEVKCAYTGEVLMPSESDGKVRYVGGFNPHMFYTRDEFLYLAAMRDGESPYPKPGPGTRVTNVTRVDMPARRRNKDRGGDLSGEAVSLAAAAMQKHKDVFDGQTTVHVSRNPGGGKRR